jgi:nitrogen-specific signal transduction histidine kinase
MNIQRQSRILMDNYEHRIDTSTLLHVIDNLTTAIVLVNRNRRVILANRMAEILSQRSKHEIYGLRGGAVLGCVHASHSPEGCGYSAPCKFCTIMQNVVRTFKTKTEVTFFDAGMELRGIGYRWLSVSTHYILVDSVESVLISIEDVTEARQKSKLEKANAQLSAVIETAGAVCHELNQPMTVVSGYIQLLLADRQGTKPDFDCLLQMSEEIDRMKAVTRKLMRINAYQTKVYAGVSRILDIDRSSQT